MIPSRSRWPAFLLALLLSTLGTAAAPTQKFAEKIAPLIDPARLEELGERRANPHVQEAVYWLEMARREKATASRVLDAAMKQVHYPTVEAAALTKKRLLSNLKSASSYGCLDDAGLEAMKDGKSPTITKGPSTDQKLSVDHVIPIAVVPELENVIANLRFLPLRENQRKKDKITKAARDLAGELYRAGLLSMHGYGAIQSQPDARPRKRGTPK